jgi:hypothetical protein
MTEPKAMREIHEIREKIHEERKTMTTEESIARVNASMINAQKEYGFKITYTMPEPRYK